ncbi:MAG: OmpA family protein [Leptospiraceae bacterium]|nr:OmpA family protein [Leptospiraceae bacterium]
MNSKTGKIAAIALLSSSLVITSCETFEQYKNTIIGTGIGCTAGLLAGTIYDEAQRKKSNKDRRNDVFAIFKKRKAENNGKMVGLGVGCLAGLGTGLYLDLMKDDMEDQFGSRGIELEKVAGAGGETEKLKVKMDGDISFETGSANLRGVASSNVSTLSEALEKYPETKVSIWGHTDGTGSRATNDRLSKARAEMVANQLGISSSRIAETKGWANDVPLPGTNKAGNVAANRRVEVFIEGNP